MTSAYSEDSLVATIFFGLTRGVRAPRELPTFSLNNENASTTKCHAHLHTATAAAAVAGVVATAAAAAAASAATRSSTSVADGLPLHMRRAAANDSGANVAPKSSGY
eukprot:4929173-Pleurochrysis_carterae.AAC.1